MTQAISRADTTPPRLGIVLLDLPHLSGTFGLFPSSSLQGLGSLPPGSFECPASWRFPTAYAVAPGASVAETLRAGDTAELGVRTAVERLAVVSDLVIGDCGFFWRPNREGRRRSSVPELLSGLDLLEIAGAVTALPVGVLTFSEEALHRLLVSHPLSDRLRLVGLSDRPTWSLLAVEDYAVDRSWCRGQLEAELHALLTGELSDGSLRDVGALVIECTHVPQFRPLLRSLTSLPIFDVAAAATALLDEQVLNGKPHDQRSEGRSRVA